MLSDPLYNFISGRKHLIWYVKDYRSLSEESIVEAVLNYGNWEDVQTFIKIKGLEETRGIFNKTTQKSRVNYPDNIKHYFSLYFNRTYAL